MGKAKRKTKPARDTRIAPTPEAQAHGNYGSAGMAYRRIPMIDTLRDTGKLTDDQHRVTCAMRLGVDAFPAPLVAFTCPDCH